MSIIFLCRYCLLCNALRWFEFTFVCGNHKILKFTLQVVVFGQHFSCIGAIFMHFKLIANLVQTTEITKREFI